MGFRFRKSFNLGPFRATLSKSGIGSSIGFKGFRYTLRADGKRQKTLSVPGTGLSFVDISKSDSTAGPDSEQVLGSAPSQAKATHWGRWIFVFVFVLLMLFWIIQFFK